MTGRPQLDAGAFQAPLRTADELLVQKRIGAFWPTRLSFSHIMSRKASEGRWQIRRVLQNLDDEGVGRVAYEIEAGDELITFYVFSRHVPPDEQEDRIIATQWDALAFLRTGRASEEELDRTERDLPIVIRGRASLETLMWTRANRSTRLFEHIVQRLARGDQPDPATLANVGYLMRTTGFAANGRNGTRTFHYLRETGHPLSSVYQVQMLAALMWREYSFDLVEHLARVVNPRAAEMDPRLKRLVGIGNSSGVGLTPFVTRHPKLINAWILEREKALADAKSVRVAPGDHAVQRLQTMVADGARYFGEQGDYPYGLFTPPPVIASELRRTAGLLEEFSTAGTMEGDPVEYPWYRLAEWSGEQLEPESDEAINTLLLDLYPAMTDRYEEHLVVEETFDIVPEMRVGDVAGQLRQNFAWVEDISMSDAAARHFYWYISEENLEPRRGPRPEDLDDFEIPLDVVGRLQLLDEALQSYDHGAPIARFLLEHPDLRFMVGWVVSLSDAPYALPRMNLLSEDFVPLHAMRFLLSMYGMLKFSPRSDSWVRGTLLQGCPTATEYADGATTQSMFPLIPTI